MEPSDPPAVFAEPWQAHAFALAVHLADAGYFTWKEWTTALAQEIKVGGQTAGDGSAYYVSWLNALERMCAGKGLVAVTSMGARREEWRQAYLHTPHGQPVELAPPCGGGRSNG